MSDEVLLDRADGVLTITINRPHAKNALNGAVGQAIAAAADELDASSDLRVGVLTGAGGVFSAGMDLKAFLTGDTPMVEGRGLCGITETPPRKPMIAAVEGWALAGGFELVLACDLVVAADTARFGVPEVKRGLLAAGGAALLLSERIPRALALELLLTGEPWDAARAASVGLVNQVVPAGAAVEAATALARTIAANGPLAVAVTKEVALGGGDLAAGWARNQAGAIRVMGSHDAIEGATAFAQKRPPVWTGA